MQRRGYTRVLDDETELTQDNEAKICESSVSEVRLSTDPKQQCRFILIGGDETAKNDACRYILRPAQTQQFQRTNLQSCEMKVDYVQGRHVCVVKSPSYWLEHLTSRWFFSTGLKTIKNEMKHCVSLVFPGPHAFLLVIRAGQVTQREHCLLQAISSLFGDEALEYSIVLFVKGSGERSSQNTKSRSVSMCKNQYHLLVNTDQSVQELFRKVEKMLSKKRSKFFIPSAYEHFMKVNFESWEKERIDSLAEYKDKANELNNELEEMKRMQDRQREVEQASGTNLIQWGSNDILPPDF